MLQNARSVRSPESDKEGMAATLGTRGTRPTAIAGVTLEPRPAPAPGNLATGQRLSASARAGYLRLTQVGTTYTAQQHKVRSLVVRVV